MTNPSNRHQWIERALDGIERFSNSSLTTDQKNAISVQFGVLMDQLEVAVGALSDSQEDIEKWRNDTSPGQNSHIASAQFVIKEALEQLKSSKFSI